MASVKISAKTTETVEFLDYIIIQCGHMAGSVEEFAQTKKSTQADWLRQGIIRELGHLRQRAMTKNLGVLADEIGRLAVLSSGGGSQQMKARIMRDGVGSLLAACARFRKGFIDADKAGQKASHEQADQGE